MSAAVPRVYLDANVFIAAFENPGAHSDHAWWILDAVERGEIVGGTSEITLAEVLVKPLDVGAIDLAKGYQEMISNGSKFEVVSVRRDILIEAARFRSRRRSLKLPDAVHLASALALSCSYMISDDQKLPVVPDIKMLPVSPFTLNDIFSERK